MQPTMANSIQQPTGAIDKLTFNKMYWFSALQMVEVINPAWLKDGDGFTVQDYPFQVEMRHFFIKAGGKEKFPGVIANVYLDQMTKILAQNDGKLEFMSDPNLMKIYYDKLIVDVENLAPEYNPVPSYLRGVAPSAVGQAIDDTPPWEKNMEQARAMMPDNAPQIDPRVSQLETKVNGMGDLLGAIAEKMGIGTTTQPVTTSPPSVPIQETTIVAPVITEPTEKQFQYLEDIFKMTIDKNGDEMFFKNGRRTSSAEYAKAASML